MAAQTQSGMSGRMEISEAEPSKKYWVPSYVNIIAFIVFSFQFATNAPLHIMAMNTGAR